MIGVVLVSSVSRFASCFSGRTLALLITLCNHEPRATGIKYTAPHNMFHQNFSLSHTHTYTHMHTHTYIYSFLIIKKLYACVLVITHNNRGTTSSLKFFSSQQIRFLNNIYFHLLNNIPAKNVLRMSMQTTM